jgi:hypothetical protein
MNTKRVNVVERNRWVRIGTDGNYSKLKRACPHTSLRRKSDSLIVST